MSKPFKGMTIEELRAEHERWKNAIANATSWGASLAAADEFRKDIERELSRRGETP